MSETTKTLTLYCERKEGVSSKNGKPYAFDIYYVIVNGIRINLYTKVGDDTAKLILENYYKGGQN